MFERIFYDICYTFINYLPYAIITGVILMMAICISMHLVLKDKLRSIIILYGKKLLVVYISYIYCFMVVSITFLSREPGSRDQVDLILFNTFSGKQWENIYPIENIILFIPFGVLIPSRFYWYIQCRNT